MSQGISGFIMDIPQGFKWIPVGLSGLHGVAWVHQGVPEFE